MGQHGGFGFWGGSEHGFEKTSCYGFHALIVFCGQQSRMLTWALACPSFQMEGLLWGQTLSGSMWCKAYRVRMKESDYSQVHVLTNHWDKSWEADGLFSRFHRGGRIPPEAEEGNTSTSSLKRGRGMCVAFQLCILERCLPGAAPYQLFEEMCWRRPGAIIFKAWCAHILFVQF